MLLQKKGPKGRPMTSVHSRHHVTYPSKNFASSNKGFVGAAPGGRGILNDAAAGNVPGGLHRTGIVPPPRFSHHNKPSAALYGATTQLKKSSSAVHGNLPHKPHAVHAGIPHAQKLPASDKNTTLRCTWSTTVVPPVTRTVTQVLPNKQSRSAQPYRAPSPPQCPADIESPYGCQEDLRRKLELMRLRAAQESPVFLLFTLYFCYIYSDGSWLCNRKSIWFVKKPAATV